MSPVLERIAHYWLRLCDAGFLTPRNMFTSEDEPLLKAGVFTLSDQEATSVLCPFGCGDIEPVTLFPNSNREDDRVVICRRGEGDWYLKPEDYQLMAFDPEAYARYCGGKPQVNPTASMESDPMGLKSNDNFKSFDAALKSIQRKLNASLDNERELLLWTTKDVEKYGKGVDLRHPNSFKEAVVSLTVIEINRHPQSEHRAIAFRFYNEFKGVPEFYTNFNTFMRQVNRTLKKMRNHL